MGRRLAFRARYLFTAAGPPLRDAWLTVEGGRIVAVGPAAGEQRDLGNVALLPGFVNPHTHLEFSQLPAPIGRAGMGFAAWIREVVAWKRRQQTSAADEVEWRARAIQRGITESLQAGVKICGEIATPPCLADSYRTASAFSGVAFLELLGLAPEQTDRLMTLAQEHLTLSIGFTTGLSPHAPYTVGPALLQRVVRLAEQRRFPVAMHLAESAEELELLQSHGGELVKLLAQLDAWCPAAIPRGTQPANYLELLARAPRSLVVHGNYLSDDEIRFIAARAESMSVIYCPRTHAFFQHPDYPLASMLAAGVNVAVGTDSRASNPSLSVLDELRWVARHHRQVTAEAVLRLGTINAARALGCDRDWGTLEPGKAADVVVLPLPESETHDAYELIFDSSLEPQQLPIAGLGNA